MGEWFFLDKAALRSRGAGGNIYRSRTGAESTSSMSDATVRLNRRNGATGPTGLYRCVISDSYGVEQTLFVGIYTSNVNSKLMLFSILLLNTLLL